MNEKYVTPSLLNIKKDQRLEIANILINNGIKWIHYDIMDGQFVPNTAISTDEIINIKNNTLNHIMDAHLMVNNPFHYAEILKNTVDYVTLHFEAIENSEIQKFINQYKNIFKIGLAIKPQTQFKEIKNFINQVDLILVMSVNPGAGGQSFIAESLNKIKIIKDYINKNNLKTLIQVDGGINNITGPQCLNAGADAIVSGSYLVFEPTKEKINLLFGKGI